MAAVVGLNLSGGEFGTVPGVYGTDYTYESQASLDALAALGVRHLRVPLRMERFFATPGGTQVSAEWTRLDQYVTRIATAGMTCALEWHNFGRFRISGVDQLLGSALYTQAQHAAMFGVLAARYATSPTVTRLGSNEPHDLTSVAGTFTPVVTRYSFEAAAGYGLSPYGSGSYGF